MIEDTQTKESSNVTALKHIRDIVQRKQEERFGKFQAQVSEEQFKDFHVTFNDGTEGTIPYDMLMDSRMIRDRGILILRVYRRFIGLKGTCIHEIDQQLRRQKRTILKANSQDQIHRHFERGEPTIETITETRSEILGWIADYPALQEWMDI